MTTTKPKPNRQQRRATIHKPTPKAPSGPPTSVTISDETDRKRLTDLDQKVAEARKDLGKQQRLVCQLTHRRDQASVGGNDEELGEAQMQLMLTEQKRNELTQSFSTASQELTKGANEIATKYGIPVGDPNAGRYNFDIKAFVITKTG